MKIAFITLATGEYRIGAAVLMKSLAERITQDVVDLICITDDLNEIAGFFRASGCKLVTTRGSLVNKPAQGNVSTRFSCTLDKLQFFDYATKEYDRIVFLDSDMLAIGDISLLMSEELSCHAFWGVRDYACHIYHPNELKASGLNPRIVLNTGLMVVNCARFNLSKNDFVEYICKYPFTYDGGDQGYVNSLLQRRNVDVGLLPVEYNYAMDPYYPSSNYDKIAIFHYTGLKPWNAHRGYFHHSYRAYLDWYHSYFCLASELAYGCI